MCFKIIKKTKIYNTLKEFINYIQVRGVIFIISMVWIFVFVDILKVSGLITALSFNIVFGIIGFFLHKFKGAKF